MPERPRFYADEHIARPVIVGLRNMGIDILRAQDVGLRGASDADHLSFAPSQGRVVVTRDADFLRLNRAGVAHSGILFLVRSVGVGDVVRAIARLHVRMSDIEMIGRVKYE